MIVTYISHYKNWNIDDLLWISMYLTMEFNKKERNTI